MVLAAAPGILSRTVALEVFVEVVVVSGWRRAWIIFGDVVKIGNITTEISLLPNCTFLIHIFISLKN